MITLIKDKDYFNELKDNQEGQVLFISNNEKNNISSGDLSNLLKNSIYNSYFLEYTPHLDFLSRYKDDNDKIYLLVENISLIPVTLKIKSKIIMEKEKKIDIYEKTSLDENILRCLILEIIKTQMYNNMFKKITYDLGEIFFARDSKSALEAFQIICNKYEIKIN